MFVGWLRVCPWAFSRVKSGTPSERHEGVLVDQLGWRWIFFVNLPVDIIGLALAVWLIPALPTQRHRFDFIGVILSGAGLLLIVFALQEGQAHDWALWISGR